MELALDQMRIYAFCDPASGRGKNKRIQARQALVVCADDYLSRKFVLKAWAGKIQTTGLRDKLLSEYGKWNPALFGIEANAMQILFGDLIIDEARRRFGVSRFVPVYQPTKVEKDFRIRTVLEPLLTTGRLFVPANMDDLRVELRGFPTGQYKDILDALASCINLMPPMVTKSEKTGELERLAQYLRSTGCHPRIIEQRIKQVSEEMGLDVNDLERPLREVRSFVRPNYTR